MEKNSTIQTEFYDSELSTNSIKLTELVTGAKEKIPANKNLLDLVDTVTKPVATNYRKSIIKRAVHPGLVSSTPFAAQKNNDANSFSNLSSLSINSLSPNQEQEMPIIEENANVSRKRNDNSCIEVQSNSSLSIMDPHESVQKSYEKQKPEVNHDVSVKSAVNKSHSRTDLESIIKENQEIELIQSFRKPFAVPDANVSRKFHKSNQHTRNEENDEEFTSELSSESVESSTHKTKSNKKNKKRYTDQLATEKKMKKNSKHESPSKEKRHKHKYISQVIPESTSESYTQEDTSLYDTRNKGKRKFHKEPIKATTESSSESSSEEPIMKKKGRKKKRKESIKVIAVKRNTIHRRRISRSNSRASHRYVEYVTEESENDSEYDRKKMTKKHSILNKFKKPTGSVKYVVLDDDRPHHRKELGHRKTILKELYKSPKKSIRRIVEVVSDSDVSFRSDRARRYRSVSRHSRRRVNGSPKRDYLELIPESDSSRYDHDVEIKTRDRIRSRRPSRSRPTEYRREYNPYSPERRQSHQTRNFEHFDDRRTGRLSRRDSYVLEHKFKDTNKNEPQPGPSTSNFSEDVISNVIDTKIAQYLSNMFGHVKQPDNFREEIPNSKINERKNKTIVNKDMTEDVHGQDADVGSHEIPEASMSSPLRNLCQRLIALQTLNPAQLIFSKQDRKSLVKKMGRSPLGNWNHESFRLAKKRLSTQNGQKRNKKISEVADFLKRRSTMNISVQTSLHNSWLSQSTTSVPEGPGKIIPEASEKVEVNPTTEKPDIIIWQNTTVQKGHDKTHHKTTPPDDVSKNLAEVMPQNILAESASPETLHDFVEPTKKVRRSGNHLISTKLSFQDSGVSTYHASPKGEIKAKKVIDNAPQKTHKSLQMRPGTTEVLEDLIQSPKTKQLESEENLAQQSRQRRSGGCKEEEEFYNQSIGEKLLSPKTTKMLVHNSTQQKSSGRLDIIEKSPTEKGENFMENVMPTSRQRKSERNAQQAISEQSDYNRSPSVKNGLEESECVTQKSPKKKSEGSYLQKSQTSETSVQKLPSTKLTKLGLEKEIVIEQSSSRKSKTSEKEESVLQMSPKQTSRRLEDDTNLEVLDNNELHSPKSKKFFKTRTLSQRSPHDTLRIETEEEINSDKLGVVAPSPKSKKLAKAESVLAKSPHKKIGRLQKELSDHEQSYNDMPSSAKSKKLSKAETVSQKSLQKSPLRFEKEDNDLKQLEDDTPNAEKLVNAPQTKSGFRIGEVTDPEQTDNVPSASKSKKSANESPHKMPGNSEHEFVDFDQSGGVAPSPKSKKLIEAKTVQSKTPQKRPRRLEKEFSDSEQSNNDMPSSAKLKKLLKAVSVSQKSPQKSPLRFEKEDDDSKQLEDDTPNAQKFVNAPQTRSRSISGEEAHSGQSGKVTPAPKSRKSAKDTSHNAPDNSEEEFSDFVQSDIIAPSSKAKPSKKADASTRRSSRSGRKVEDVETGKIRNILQEESGTSSETTDDQIFKKPLAVPKKGRNSFGVKQVVQKNENSRNGTKKARRKNQTSTSESEDSSEVVLRKSARQRKQALNPYMYLTFQNGVQSDTKDTEEQPKKKEKKTLKGKKTKADKLEYSDDSSVFKESQDNIVENISPVKQTQIRRGRGETENKDITEILGNTEQFLDPLVHIDVEDQIDSNLVQNYLDTTQVETASHSPPNGSVYNPTVTKTKSIPTKKKRKKRMPINVPMSKHRSKAVGTKTKAPKEEKNNLQKTSISKVTEDEPSMMCSEEKEVENEGSQQGTEENQPTKRKSSIEEPPNKKKKKTDSTNSILKKPISEVGLNELFELVKLKLATSGSNNFNCLLTDSTYLLRLAPGCWKKFVNREYDEVYLRVGGTNSLKVGELYVKESPKFFILPKNTSAEIRNTGQEQAVFLYQIGD